MNVTIKKAQSIKNFIQHRPTSISLDGSVEKIDDEKGLLLRSIKDERIKPPEDLAYENIMKEKIRKELTPQEEIVVNLKFGIDDRVSRTLEEVGKELGLTRERIRQILKKALNKMKEKEEL